MNTAINALKPGQSFTMSESNGFRVVAERSGNGKTIRIVRESNSGFRVISERNYSEQS